MAVTQMCGVYIYGRVTARIHLNGSAAAHPSQMILWIESEDSSLRMKVAARYTSAGSYDYWETGCLQPAEEPNHEGPCADSYADEDDGLLEIWTSVPLDYPERLNLRAEFDSQAALSESAPLTVLRGR